jgi:starch synthase (maltosyl-transferring)
LKGDGRARVIIDSVSPSVDGGRYPVKRVAGETVRVTAVAFADGHDQLRVQLLHRQAKTRSWTAVEMTPGYNDTWTAEFTVPRVGRYEYSVRAWVDHAGSWLDAMRKKLAAGVDVSADALHGAGLLEQRAGGAGAEDAAMLRSVAAALRRSGGEPRAIETVLTPALVEAARRADPAEHATEFRAALPVIVDRPLARCSAWYEFFPRSTGSGGRHGTFRDAERMLEYVADLGFSVVYLPPIHPIGVTNRKGPNNALRGGPGDPGSPWAIGSADGGHKAIHPELGTFKDFERFIARAQELGLAVAIDIAFQCSPDHPLIAEHPEWFKHRPDGSIAYAENPPKKYEDVVPFDFETEDWAGLWQELLDTFLFWVAHGVTVFRVDNPHTKPYPFWAWLIAEVKAKHPEVIFLAEAFTRPALLHGLAMLGFDQSYNYFPWRNTRHEIETYLAELSQGPGREYLRPNLWANTPDILTEYLQTGGRPAFTARFVLAATLGANYGIYGPAFELCEAEPREPGSEEYRNSEKYQLREWDLDAEWSLRHLIKRVNQIRAEHPALQQDWNLRFLSSDNPQIICFVKYTDGGEDAVVTTVNLDPHYAQAGHVFLDLDLLGIEHDATYQAHDLLGGGRYLWTGPRAYIGLEPGSAHVFVLRHHVRTEQDFEYFA